MTWTTIGLMATLLAAAPDVELQTLDDQTISGPLLSLTPEAATVESADGPVSLQIDSLLWLAPKGSPSPSEDLGPVTVRTADGSWIAADDYRCEGGEAVVETAGGTVRLPRDQILAVRLVPADDETLARWRELTEAEIPGDLLVIRKDESIDYHRGIVRDVTDQRVQFDLDGELLPVKRSKVFGIVHYRAEGHEADRPTCHLRMADGSRWAARNVRLSGSALSFTTAGGVEISRPLEAVVAIDFSQGKMTYLCNLDPESSRWTPFFPTSSPLEARQRFFKPRAGRPQAPRPLTLDGDTCRNALVLHSRTELVYRLPEDFGRFKARVGIADSVRPQGHVQVTIQADGRTIWEAAVAGSDPAETVVLPLDGASRLAIICDYGENLDIGDHLVLDDAKVLK
jgi:hypothetical protein